MPVVTSPAPSSLPPSGTAGGDLGGTYPNPTTDLNTAGGTMSGAVTVDVGALAGAGGVTVQGTGTANVNRLLVDFPHTDVRLTGDGYMEIASDDYMEVDILGTAGTKGELFVGGGANGASVDILVGDNSTMLQLDRQTDTPTFIDCRNATVDPIFRVNQNGAVTIVTQSGDTPLAVAGSSGAATVLVSVGGALMIRNNSAPASGDLSAGDCALWFDKTNGTAALNIKAKQADGTVKTATIPVIT